MTKDQKLKLICYFMIIATFIYVFSGLAGLNMPVYYPVLRQWSIIPIEKAVGMAYYGKLFFALVLGAAFAFLGSLVKRRFTNEEELIGITKGTVILGLFFYLAEEWHKWGIEKMKFDTKNFLNYEFWYFLALTVLFVSILCIASGGCRRKKN